MGQKMACLGLRGTTRSRQDEPKEVGEVGSKRTSSGCNGVHHVWWGGLIFRLLTRPVPAVRDSGAGDRSRVAPRSKQPDEGS
jgi:hypothetical protein